MRFLMIFIAIPLIELWLLFQVADVVGGFETVLLVIFTAFLGVMLLRSQGLSTLARASQKWQMGGLPAQELIEGFMLAFCGALLLTPGFITDALGFLILLPPVRRWVAGQLAAKGVNSLVQGFSAGPSVRFGAGAWGEATRSRFGGRTFEGTVTEASFAANDAPQTQGSSKQPDAEVIDAEIVTVSRDDSTVSDKVVVLEASIKRSPPPSDEDVTVIDVSPTESQPSDVPKGPQDRPRD